MKCAFMKLHALQDKSCVWDVCGMCVGWRGKERVRDSKEGLKG